MIAVLVLSMPTIYAQTATTSHYFGQVMVGAGWSVVFSIVNTGPTTVNGTLSLRGQDGSPLYVRIDGVVGANFRLKPMPPGSVRRLIAEPVDVAGPFQVGWAKYENIGGNITVAATYQHQQENVVKALVGVRSSQLVNEATIPVYNDLAVQRAVAFAVANPNASPLSLRLTTLNENGLIQNGPLVTSQLTLQPNAQTTIFLHQLLPSLATFTGSIVLSAQEAQDRFVVAAFLQNQKLLTAVPVINEAAPGTHSSPGSTVSDP
jgi:hypothetical protein